MRKIIGAIIGFIVIAVALTACVGESYATPKSDQHLCVFDGSERGGQKLKFQLPPASESRKIDSNDQVVALPSSNRFYMANADRNLADAGAPNFYTGNASGGTPVTVQGQVRFRFNLAKACEWFSKHGRRNTGDGVNLGFNVRGDPNQGWFRFLNENFGLTMQEVVTQVVGRYDWAKLHYNYPVNSNGAGVVTAGEQTGPPTREQLGVELGQKFTNALTANLGGEYFCGIGVSESDDACPDMGFQVTYAGPGNDSSLVKDREKVEQTKQALETARLEGELKAAQQGQLIAAEQAKQALLDEQAKTAERQAQIDTAKCRYLASAGLDCEGKRPQPIITG